MPGGRRDVYVAHKPYQEDVVSRAMYAELKEDHDKTMVILEVLMRRRHDLEDALEQNSRKAH